MRPRSIAARLHRHLRLVSLDAVEDIDWSSGVVRVSDDAEDRPVSLA